MSSASAPSPALASDKPAFTEKEQKLLVAALMSLKAGAPEIDYLRFQKNGGFNTLKTAQNTWGTLKKKIKEVNPDAAEAAEAAATAKKGDAAAAAATTPATPKPTPKKRTKKEVDSNGASETPEAEAEEGSAPKKSRTPRSKKSTPEEVGEVPDADGSPKKKAIRKTPAKKGKASAKKDDTDEAVATAADTTEPDAAAIGAEGDDDAAPSSKDIKMEGHEL